MRAHDHLRHADNLIVILSDDLEEIKENLSKRDCCSENRG